MAVGRRLRWCGLLVLGFINEHGGWNGIVLFLFLVSSGTSDVGLNMEWKVDEDKEGSAHITSTRCGCLRVLRWCV